MRLKVLVAAAVLVLLTAASLTSADATDFSRPFFDRNGDFADAPVIVRPDVSGNLQWFFQDSATPVTFGKTSDALVPGDYDGDGIVDAAIVRRGTPDTWSVAFSSGGFLTVSFGDDAQGDRLVPADFDGDGVTDMAVWRPTSPAATWFIRNSSGGFGVHEFGDGARDEPVPADFDCDGRADLTVRRVAAGLGSDTDFIIQSSDFGDVVSELFGTTSDTYVPSDVNGDTCADLTVVRQLGDGTLRWLSDINGGGFQSVDWGNANNDDDIAPADYNGDGITDIAVFRQNGPHGQLLARDGATGRLIQLPPFGNTATDTDVVSTYNSALLN
jgi:hypothetical protein